MSFELTTQDNPDGTKTERVEETITHTHQTKKIWLHSQLEVKIAELAAEIETLQERKTLLESQIKKFTVAVKEIVKEE